MRALAKFFVATATVLLPLISVSPLRSADAPVRSAASIEAERSARELFAAGEYEKAIPALERAVAADPHDLTDASLLGMAYLYSSSHIEFAANLSKAQVALDKVIADGGEAVFLVGRADDPIKRMSIHIVKVIQGELRICKDSIRFVPARSAVGAMGPLVAGEIKECGFNHSYGKDSNAFHFKLQKGSVDFRPLHFSKDESDLVCSLSAKYLGTKTTN